MDSLRHFLLIDDNVADQLLAEEAFQQLCPECTLTCVTHGQTALEMLRAKVIDPDVILLDINMPGMNGFEVLQALKADPELAWLPVVMLSTSSAKADIREAYILHASSYLVKAGNFEHFLQQIDTFLGFWQKCRVIHT
ncbi:response regulator [Deinococcus malanensis]|uniref:Response regulator n=1 Tax=Deinococcus malanensis TaxID=1706855 RepID=A0ABQ2EYZ8_9DEIO|nr:response regulator [Deinococcus malanensis]GGK33364.1 response regulator [Deinococcus malanensis]